MVCCETEQSRWGLMLSVDGPYSIVFNVETLKILLFTVMEDLAVKCCRPTYAHMHQMGAWCDNYKICKICL